MPAAQPTIPLTGADAFVLSVNELMRRSGQDELVSQSRIELDRLPDLDALQSTANRLAAVHPLLHARITRSLLTSEARWHPIPSAGRGLPLQLWHDPAATPPADHPFTPAPPFEAWAEDLLNTPRPDPTVNLRLDLYLRPDTTAVLILSWSHLLFDGKGAEYFATELASTGAPESENHATRKLRPLDLPSPNATSSSSILDNLKKSFVIMDRLNRFSRLGFQSLSGPTARPGRIRALHRTFDPTDSETIRARARALTGPLFNLAYFLAAVTRAHRAVFRDRGQDPDRYVVSIPIQVRRKGAKADFFQNRMSIMFFGLERDTLDTLEHATKSAHQQFADMTRQKLEVAFGAMMQLMRRLPARPYMGQVRWQFNGEITSFFHSHTGPFAPDLTTLHGARVTNAYHVPSLCNPPGSGVFCNENQGCLTVVTTWRDGSVTDAEAKKLLAATCEDLLGAPLHQSA